jgi:AraC-like DNA-binding protein
MASELVAAVRRYTDAQAGPGPLLTPIPGLIILRSDHEKPPAHLIFKPALCVVVQGAKWTIFGKQRFDYGPGQALVVSVETPAFSRVAQASAELPYLGLVLEFDVSIMRDVLEGMAQAPAPGSASARGIYLTQFDGALAACVLRLVQLLATPAAIEVVAPLIKREICYWLLAGPQGGDVANMVLAHSHTQRVINAINTLRERFAEPVMVDELAAIAKLSPSAFHRQFKALTALSPMQYQKQMRLLEARHLLVEGAANAETAALRVGYESASQFSREYARMFGAPPRRDAARIQPTAPAQLLG